MSFAEMKVTELREVADQFGLDSAAAKNKNELVELLGEEGVTFTAWQAFNTPADDAPSKDELPPPVKSSRVKSPDLILVRMNRANPYFESVINGNKYAFEGAHPFVAMPEDDAQTLFDTEEGFAIATPNEVKSYYA